MASGKTDPDPSHNPQIPDQTWERVGKHLGYNAQETDIYRKDPRNTKVMRVAQEMREKTIVFEVVESHGCNSQHTVGTRFYYTGDGNLITKMAPPRVCAYAFPVMTQAIYGMQELWYAGIDPNGLCFKRAGCFDVGIQCGGWGHIVVEAKLLSREEAKQLHQNG